MNATPLEWLSATDAARAIREGLISSEQLVEACLARIDAAEPAVQAWQYLDPKHALEQARARPRAQGGAAVRAAARRAGRHQGHHRHRRHADRGRHGAACRAHAGPRRKRGCAAARGGRGDHGQDRDHRMRHLYAGQDAQSAQRRAYARRLVLRLGCGGRGGHGAARARQPDQRIGDPAGRVLRRVRIQADAWTDFAPRHPQTFARPRPGRRVRAHGSRTRPCSPSSSPATTKTIWTHARERVFRSCRRWPGSRRSRRISPS